MANTVAYSLPDAIKRRAQRLIRHYNYSNSELHANLLYFFGSFRYTDSRLPRWKKILFRIGPRSWELRSLFEDISALTAKIHASDKVILEKKHIYEARHELHTASEFLRRTMAPFFDHIRSAEAVFIPFISPRSGFGIAPKNGHIIVAFGAGLDSHDHRMTIWHELLHYPVRRVIEESRKRNGIRYTIKTRNFVAIEENIVAVLTDYLCPVLKSRPAMEFDSLILEKLKTAGQLERSFSLDSFVESVIADTMLN